MEPKVTLVSDSSGLDRLCKHLDEYKTGAFDFEFIPERTYFPLLCLVQVCVEDTAYIVDPLKLKDLTALWKRIADPEIKCIFHAGSQDLELAFGLSGLVPSNIFDTQIMAGFAGLGYSAGYGRLLSQVLEVEIPKTESFSDWQARPLSDAQIEYAVNDVIHLEPLCDEIMDRLVEQGRLDWAMEECKAYEELDTYERDKEQDFMRIKGASSLTPRGLAILRELWWWRDDTARRINRPARSVLADSGMLELAKRRVDSIESLKKMRGLRADTIKGFGKDLFEAIMAGKAVPDSECPVWPSGKVPYKSELLAGDFLYLMLKCRAMEIGLAPEHLTTRDELQSLLKCHKSGELSDTSEFKLLKGWRYEYAGQLVLSLLDGQSVQVKIA
ncbi:MAG: ribonuclease D, partial [Cyanobacteria bacterium]|nr:ribonuclease D [Cyanobacteriota bacterium]